MLAVSGALIALVELLPEAALARAIREQQVGRDVRLRELVTAHVVDAKVAPIRLPVPDTLHYVDVGTDPGQWNNVCTAKHYGLRTIALDPAP